MYITMTPTEPLTTSETEALKMFDERFGKAGLEKNCDSTGRGAGCDDCARNIETREEHRAFLRTILAAKDAEIADAEAAEKLLWDRMREWQDEWRAERPSERALTLPDTMRLIEGKAIKLSGLTIENPDQKVYLGDLKDGHALVRKGKQGVMVITLK